MTRGLLSWALLALVLLQPVYAGGQIVVVTSVKNKQVLNKDTIRAIFTDKMLSWKNGAPIQIYHLPKDSPIRHAFSEKVLGMSSDAMTHHWIRLENANQPRNKKKETNAARVKRLVSRNPNAIGYLSSKSVTKRSGLRIVYKIDY